MNEQAAIQLAQEGNPDAFQHLFNENRNKIFSLAYQYAKNAEDAEDILQETFIKAYYSIDKFQPQRETTFSAWLYRIGINCSIDHLRKNKMRKEKHIDKDDISQLPSSDNSSDPLNSGERKEVREKLTTVLNSMAPRQRMVFILRHYQQFSIAEIAESMGCSEGSVKKQLFRAFSEIKRQFRSLIPEKSYEM
jgi:RNA polymerase sigma-70 factor (ECF subfamily)